MVPVGATNRDQSSGYITNTCENFHLHLAVAPDDPSTTSTPPGCPDAARRPRRPAVAAAVAIARRRPRPRRCRALARRRRRAPSLPRRAPPLPRALAVAAPAPVVARALAVADCNDVLNIFFRYMYFLCMFIYVCMYFLHVFCMYVCIFSTIMMF